MRIVCMTMYSPSNQLLADITVPNLKEYTDRHGYELYELKIDDGKFHYEKHLAVKDLFKHGVDIIFYKDVDSLITNLQKPITDFIDTEHDFFITKDCNEINGGSLIIINTVWSRMFNDFVLFKKYDYNNEQEVYVAYQYDKRFKDKIKILPHPSINSYLYELYPSIPQKTHEEGQWEEGDFLLHLPATTITQRINIFNEYKNKIVL